MKEVNFRSVARGTGELLRRASRNVLPLFVIFSGLQIAATAAVLSVVPQSSTVGDLLEVLQGRYPVWMPVAVIVMVLMQMASGSIHAATKRVVIDDEPIEFGEAFRASMLRLPSIIGLSLVTGALFAVVVIGLVLLGVQIMVVPVMLLGFVLEPSKWLVAARDLSVFEALAETTRWARRHWLWIVGVQAAIGIAMSGVTAGLEIDPTAPLTVLAFVTGHMAVSFLQWSVLSGLFIALDRAEYS